MNSFRGIVPAIVTPLDPQGGFSPGAFSLLADRLYSAGIDGLYVCGQTGEGWQQPLEQREAVAAAAIQSLPAGKTVIVHVVAQTLSDALRLTRRV
jgi:dihydrodipicolinate synthase/N-acetylneuraminate lyase